MFCAISGNVPEEPVVSKNGHVFEKSLIARHLQLEGTCPITKESMSIEDLIPIQASKVAKPRPATATSVPGMLSVMQNEWDALMLETFTLKQHLDTVRQELSHALYQHDAASRVIARLIRERDQARHALSALRAQYNIPESEIPVQEDAPTTNGDGNADQMDTESSAVPSKLPEAVVAEVTETAVQLSKVRKNRKPAETTATSETVKQFKLGTSQSRLHKKGPKTGITSLVIHPSNSDKILTGGADSQVILYSRAKNGAIFTGKEHSDLVTGVAFHPSQNAFISASMDSSAMLWAAPEDSTGYSVAQKFDTHTAGVCGLSIHASERYFATASFDGSWAFHDINAAKTICRVVDPSDTHRCVAFHPDGLILGTGAVGGDHGSKVKIWDVKNGSNVANFEGHKKPVTCLSFSENGYHLATSSEDGCVMLWDLRKLKTLKTIEIGAPVSSVRFDYSGLYLAVGSTDVKIFASKTWELLFEEKSHKGEVTGVAFGNDASFLCSGSMDNALKFYS